MTPSPVHTLTHSHSHSIVPSITHSHLHTLPPPTPYPLTPSHSTPLSPHCLHRSNVSRSIPKSIWLWNRPHQDGQCAVHRKRNSASGLPPYLGPQLPPPRGCCSGLQRNWYAWPSSGWCVVTPPPPASQLSMLLLQSWRSVCGFGLCYGQVAPNCMPHLVTCTEVEVIGTVEWVTYCR